MPRPLIMTKISENVLIVSRCPRIPGYFGTCTDSVYQALLFPPPREARASSYAGKIETGDEAIDEGCWLVLMLKGRVVVVVVVVVVGITNNTNCKIGTSCLANSVNRTCLPDSGHCHCTSSIVFSCLQLSTPCMHHACILD